MSDVSQTIIYNEVYLDVIGTKSKQILIVDDNHFIIEATKNLLIPIFKAANINMEIIVATDGIQCEDFKVPVVEMFKFDNLHIA